MRKMKTIISIEGKLALRCPDGVIFGICMPIGILLLIGIIAGDKVIQGPVPMTFLDSAFAALTTVGICASAFMGIPINLADYRDKKILKHFYVTPSSPLLLVYGNIIIGALTAIVSALGISIVAVVFFGYRMNGNIFLFILGYFIVMVSMYSLGMLIASLCRTIKSANIVCSIVYFPMLLLSGATIPYELFPKGMQMVANIFPLTQGIKILKVLSTSGTINELILPIVYLLILSIVCVVISVKTFRWE
ncbi:ABC-2 type transport system permease protein [Aequitasia blattaphilus]|uniref:Transport permease protein n=1 Tax=Aequitasia blattaphilus TaxID=2949332 RepID=A0ABT1E7P7_9FIRM|nr:ABC transporter permease [Aequitasia blattaphilus]MCP1101839.1 ABC transporter permease [Aequitasia blattaphilus]MCR8614479.1 ABC transporter permease [Aequitasia blattaphilus]